MLQIVFSLKNTLLSFDSNDYFFCTAKKAITIWKCMYKDVDETIMCVFYGEGKLGAGVYHTATNKLGLFYDLPDGKPNYTGS